MDIVKLLLIFICIMLVVKLNKPLYVSIAAGAAAAIILYEIDPLISLRLIANGVIRKDTIYLVLALYTITFLQRMLEKRGHILLAEKALSNLFNSRRINAMVAPFVIGLLPSAGAVLIAAPIVDNAGGNYITKEEKTFITSYFRHISESFLPTYSSVLLALNLSGVDMTAFVLGMLPMVIVQFYLGYFFYIRKIPKSIGMPRLKNKSQEIKNILISLWSIALSITIILVFKIPVHLAVIPVIILSIVLNKFNFKEIQPMFITAVETKLIITTVAIMIFKEILTFTGIIERLPAYFSMLPIPSVVIFALIFFFGTLVAGSQGIIALAMPLAYATIPNGGAALMVLLMCMLYISMQVSPTHICLAIITEHYGTSFIDLVKKTIPVLIAFVVISSIYSYLLYLIL
jgi:integral membrane protein (TIGR00529 family)